MKLNLAFSPCPNDTFIFDAMVSKKINTRGIDFEYVMEDVATLNNWAMEGRHDITKLSYSTFLHCVQEYALLQSGSALGNGVGPLLVTTQEKANQIQELGAFVNNARIAIPGVNTTANMLFSLAFPGALHKTELLFSHIEQAVLENKADAGLLIHEGRFTYAQKGLYKLMDMGDWWEQNMQVPVPLGGIVIRRSMGKALYEKVDGIIRESIAYAWKHYPGLSGFVTGNAQEMEESVMRRHIELYVNDYSEQLGEKGKAAINRMFHKAEEAGIINSKTLEIPIFL